MFAMHRTSNNESLEISSEFMHSVGKISGDLGTFDQWINHSTTKLYTFNCYFKEPIQNYSQAFRECNNYKSNENFSSFTWNIDSTSQFHGNYNNALLFTVQFELVTKIKWKSNQIPNLNSVLLRAIENSMKDAIIDRNMFLIRCHHYNFLFRLSSQCLLCIA